MRAIVDYCVILVMTKKKLNKTQVMREEGVEDGTTTLAQLEERGKSKGKLRKKSSYFHHRILLSSP